MKKIFGIILFLIAFALGADVKPFVFENIDSNDSIQQDQYDYLLQYKLYGRDYITIGEFVKIPDKSGWNGSDGYITVSGNGQLLLGGPVLTDSSISLGMDCQFTTGPIRAKTLTTKERTILNGDYCLTETPSNEVLNAINRGNGKLACDSVPKAPTGLSIPTIKWPETGYQNDIILSNEAQSYTIEIPDDTLGEGQYDLYYHNIHLCTDGHNNCDLFIKMKNNRLTRIFVDSLFIGNHSRIRVMLGDSILPQSKYRGNVLIYSNKDIVFKNTDNEPLQGSFITTSKISLICNLDFAGQLLANQLEIGNQLDGKNFKFVKFDPDTLDFPELNKQGGLYEDNQTVIIPLQLSDTSTIDVYFTYCFDLKDGVTTDDFNMPPNIPVCGETSITTKIPIGSKTPVDTIKVNVKKDTLVEPNEYLILHIDSITGAILPNGETSGELKIKINDAPVGHVEFDTTKTYKFEENKLGEVDQIKILNGTATTRFHLDSSDRYTLDSITGVLTLVGEPLDYEKDSIDVIKVTLTDTGNVSITRNIPISVIDVNEAPVLKDTITTLSENLDNPKRVLLLVAEDEDIKPEFTQNIFSMLEGDTSLFRVDSDGELWTKKTFDYETDQKTYTIKVLVQDKNDPSLKDSAIVTVNITNSNDGPKFDRNDTTFHVNENEPFKDSVKATDQDGDKITYSIVGTVPFEIDSNGVITSTRTFDYEKEKGFTFKVVADDGKAKDTMTVNIIVDTVNEPVHTKDTTFVVDEGKIGEIGKVKGEDEDGKPVKFSCDDSVHYSIDTNTGVLRLVDPFDYETTKSDTIKVFVTDGVFTDTAIVVINVNNVNEPPVLQPNDSLTVPENCKNCIVGIIIAIDPDKNDTLFYDVKEPGFKIDSTGKLTTTKPFDHETTPSVTITVVVKDSSGATDTKKYVITITDVNEPVHVEENTCKVKENYTGEICTIIGYDEDIPSIVKFDISDKTKYSIDDNGVISVIKPFDFETVDKDSVKVYVIDTRDSTIKDSAWIKIIVENEEEKVNITEWDKNPPPDTVKTNDPDHEFKWTICEGDSCITHYDNPRIHKDTTIKVCNDKKTVCDSIVVLFNDAPPVVTLTNAKSTDALIDYITIEEEKDDKIYVNKKDNELKVTVRDTIHKTEKTFPIDVKLDTVHVSSKNITEYNYLIDESLATYTQIGGGLIEVKEVVKDGDRKITLTKIVNKNMDPIDTVQTVTYTVKQDGKELTITYKTDNLTGQRVSDYEVSYKVDSCTTVSYYLGDDKKITKNKEGNIAFTVSYVYTDDFGNKASSKVDIIFDNIPPKVEISDPAHGQVFNTNAIPVKWTVNGIVQDTLNLQRLEKGVNNVIRRYVDKAGNVSADTVMVIMKEAKDIDIDLVHPVTMVDQDKVDEYYSEGHKYNDKKPYDVKFVDPKNDTLPDVIGVGFKVDIVLPSVSPTGSLATLDDIVKNGQIPVDDNGNIVGASTHGIPVDQYVEEHCTEEFQKDYQKHGLNIPLYDVTYNLHLWVYTNAANYVNDFNIEFTLNDEAKTTSAGTVQMVIDWLADKDGTVKAKNKHALGTGAYLTKLYSKSVAKHRCDYKEQRKGDRTVKKDETFKIFGFKRPNKK